MRDIISRCSGKLSADAVYIVDSIVSVYICLL